MIKGGVGGGKTITGLHFEERSDLKSTFSALPGYSIKGNDLFFDGSKVAVLFKKHGLYKDFLRPRGVDWHDVLSKQLLPDSAVFVMNNNTLYIIEMKFQETEGSVDEKLQTCDFKYRQYRKLAAKLGIKVKYAYFLCDWFKDSRYNDVREYITSVGCDYFFENIPLTFLGLPEAQHVKELAR